MANSARVPRAEATATETARGFAGIVDQVRATGQPLVVTHRGRPVCEIHPARGPRVRTLAELVELGRDLPRPDAGFWDDVEAGVREWNRIEEPYDPWES